METELTNNAKRLKKIIRSTLFNENRIIKLEKIKENKLKKEKYEKYLWYVKKNKIDFYNKKLKYKIEDLHWQIANDLALNYEVIIIGKINTSEILRSTNLNSKTKKSIKKIKSL